MLHQAILVLDPSGDALDDLSPAVRRFTDQVPVFARIACQIIDRIFVGRGVEDELAIALAIAVDPVRPGAEEISPRAAFWRKQAAALPLTSITAWELLFDRLAVPYGVKSHTGALLIVNGAGGVGSMLTQLARRLTGLTVIATASRPETVAWCGEMGAHHVVNHHRPFLDELSKLGIPHVDYVAGLTATDKHLADIESVLVPHGRFALIDDPDVLNIVSLKRKSISVHWELMFTPSLYQTADMIAQHRLLDEVADLVDARVLRTTMTANAGRINAENLKKAHALVESGRAIGKTVLSGF